MSIEFLVTTFIVVVTPGTGVIYTVAAGLSRGARASVVAAIGCTLGIVPHMVAAISGLAALLHASAQAYQTVKYLGVAYLLYMAWTTWHDRSGIVVDDGADMKAPGRVVLSGILINVLNPKLTIFFFAFLPQFTNTTGAGAGVPLMIGLSTVFMVVTLIVFTGYGVLAAQLRRHVVTRPHLVSWMRRTFAVGFVGLSARLATADQ